MPYSDFDHNYCSVWLRVLHFVSPSFEMERLNETMFSNIIEFLEEPGNTRHRDRQPLVFRFHFLLFMGFSSLRWYVFVVAR